MLSLMANDLRLALSSRGYWVVVALLVLAVVLATTSQASDAAVRAWLVRSTTASVLVYGLALFACVRGAGAFSRTMQAAVIARGVSRVSFVSARVAAEALLLLLAGLFVVTAAGLALRWSGEPHLDVLMRPDLSDGRLEGKFSAERAGDRVWLRWRPGDPDWIGLKVPVGDAGPSVRCAMEYTPALVSPERRQQGPDDSIHPLIVRCLTSNGGYEEPSGLSVSRGRVEFIAPVIDGSARIRVFAAQSQLSVGIALDRVTAAGDERGAFLGTFPMLVAAWVGSMVLLSVGVMLAARFTRASALVITVSLLLVVALGRSLGLGASAPLAEDFRNRLVSIVNPTHQKELRSRPTPWLLEQVPDLRQRELARRFVERESVPMHEAISDAPASAVIVAAALLAACGLFWRRDVGSGESGDD